MPVKTTVLSLLRGALRPVGNALRFDDENWAVHCEGAVLRVGGSVRVTNLAGEREVMLTAVQAEVTWLSHGDTAALRTTSEIRSLDKAYPPRADGYWTAYVVHPHDQTAFEVAIETTASVSGTDDGPSRTTGIGAVYAVWIAVRVDTYGSEGPRPQWHHVILPVLPADDDATTGDGTAGPSTWRSVDGGALLVLPVRTHLLTPAEDPVEMIRRYVAPHARPGDIVTIGETPLAVMQRRFRHPDQIRPSWPARRLCYTMSGEGSLGTATGLQALMDEVGTARVLWALVMGAAGKARGRNGDFYRTAGEQSRLLDDVTGTLPPYDRFLVLGPLNGQTVVHDVKAATGLDAAIVDANDLGNVDVLAATAGVSTELVARALGSNPAGNGAETTPLVLIRRA